jgi:hypothetical protein
LDEVGEGGRTSNADQLKDSLEVQRKRKVWDSKGNEVGTEDAVGKKVQFKYVELRRKD